jgi:hypothetical protein
MRKETGGPGWTVCATARSVRREVKDQRPKSVNEWMKVAKKGGYEEEKRSPAESFLIESP